MDKEVVTINRKKYTLEKKIGEGAYGVAWLAISGKKKFVIKKVSVGLRRTENMANELDFRRETELSKYIDLYNCPSLIKYLGASKGSGRMRYILMEYFDGYTIRSFIECSKETGFVINPDQFLKMAKHLLRGLACLHKYGIIHSDFNAENVMFNKKEIKIIDYGSLCTMPPSSKMEFSCYGDNEMANWYKYDNKLYGNRLLSNEYPFQVDVNAIGGMFREILGAGFLSKYKKDPRSAQIDRLVNNMKRFPPAYTAQQALDILEKIPENAINLY